MPAQPPDSNRSYWACQFGGWGGYGLIQFYVGVAFIKLPWVTTAVELLALHGSALAVTHVLRGYMRRHRWETLRALPLTPRIVLTGLVLGTPFGIVMNFMTVAALHHPDPVFNVGVGVVLGLDIPPWLMLIQLITNWSVLFAFWMMFYFIILSARKRRLAKLRQSELVRALQAAELRLLKAQLNPHFLFNSLNSVRALIADDPSRAQDAVTRLARTLRYTLAPGQEDLVMLEQELEIVDDYLALESLRLGERLKVERNISPAAMRVRIPVMLMQTLVENAIKHGIAELPEGGVLRMSARVQDGALELEIANPRPANAKPVAHEGIGLRNAAERLRLLFGAEANLDLDLSDSGQALARVRIPAP